MSTKKPVADPDIEPEYDFHDSVPNPYAERYREGHVPLVTRSDGSGESTHHSRSMLLEYDESVDTARAKAARVRGAMLIVSLVDGREVRVPIRWFPRLLAGSAAARANLQITEGGRAIRWPDLDEDIGVEPLLATVG